MRRSTRQRPQKAASHVVVRGCKLSRRRIMAIKAVVRKSRRLSRTSISLILCKRFKFYQPNGWPKDRAMRGILRALKSAGYLKLPPSRKLSQNPKINFRTTSVEKPDSSPVTNVDWSELKISAAKERKQIRMWDYLVDEHHYLGKKTIVGKNYGSLCICITGQLRALPGVIHR